MTKKVTQEDLLRAMKNPEQLKALMMLTEPIFLETVKYDLAGIRTTFWTCSKFSKIQLFEEGLLLLDRLPIEERNMVVNNLKKLNIPSPLWYKMVEENNASYSSQTKSKEPQMKDVNGKNPGEEGYITPEATATQTFMQKHGGFLKTVGWFTLGAIVGITAKAGVDKYREPSSTPSSVGSAGE
jgi:hypothetical protein